MSAPKSTEPRFWWSDKYAYEMSARAQAGGQNAHAAKQCPAAILELARVDPTIAGVLHYWKDGSLTWEQCLIAIVVEKYAQVQRLTRTLTHWHERSTPDGVWKCPDCGILEGDRHEPNCRVLREWHERQDKEIAAFRAAVQPVDQPITRPASSAPTLPTAAAASPHC
jgi:hypothetical protein